jgi:predicted dehydrogenase
MRFAPVIVVTRDLINEAASGRPMTCVMIDDQFFPIQGHYDSTWRADVTKVGAGTLLEHAIHDIDILISYFGRVKRVFGVTRHFFEKEGVEDLSSAILEFESGAVVNHVSIWHNVLHRGSSRRMHVVCENAQYMWEDDDYAGQIRCETNKTGGRTDISSEEGLARFIAGFHGIDDRLRGPSCRTTWARRICSRITPSSKPSARTARAGSTSAWRRTRTKWWMRSMSPRASARLWIWRGQEIELAPSRTRRALGVKLCPTTI